MQTVYACGVGVGGGSQQREVADGADGVDVVFTDTVIQGAQLVGNCRGYAVC